MVAFVLSVCLRADELSLRESRAHHRPFIPGSRCDDAVSGMCSHYVAESSPNYKYL